MIATVNRQPPCLYMLWPSRLDMVQVPGLPPNYKLRTYRDSDDRALFELLESDGEVMDQRAWQEYRDMLLPNRGGPNGHISRIRSVSLCRAYSRVLQKSFPDLP